MPLKLLFFISVGCTCLGTSAWAINGNSLVLKSNGSASGSDWTLADSGFVGTYITLATPGNVTIDVQAQGVASGGINPRMNLVINDETVGWDIPSGFTNYEHTFSLPAGTHFVRTEFANDPEKSSRQLQIRNLNVTGATISNTNNDANALAASNTYINNYRKGNVTIDLQGATPGATVNVSLKNHAFNFGTAVAGTNNSTIMNANPASGSTAFKFQEKLREHFNALVPENAGKWIENEFTRDSQWHPQLDKIVAFAEANGKRLRMHNLIWDNQQPNWVNTLLNSAATNATARNDLRQEISERIDYYVGDGDNDYNDGDFASKYYEIDVYNEMDHTPKYWNAYGASGIADIYNEVAAAAGPNVGIATNEYNVFQDTGDYYGNWYKNKIEQLVAADGAVSAIGIQSYDNNWGPVTSPDGCWCAHFAPRKFQTLQNLAVLDMPITLTEFGVKAGTSPARAATIMEETMRVMFGSPNATGFYMWGFWAGAMWDQAPAAALFDANWNLTVPGQKYMDLMAEWNTQLTTTVGPDGTINFDGFWGDYEITIDGETFPLTLNKGNFDYSLIVEESLAGDFDFDGDVDGRDFLAWQRGESLNPFSAEDLADWHAAFNVGSLAASMNIPEPNSIVIMVVSTSLLGLSLRTRKFIDRHLAKSI
jgi:endo-1,4-beta-xylanase